MKNLHLRFTALVSSYISREMAHILQLDIARLSPLVKLGCARLTPRFFFFCSVNDAYTKE